MNNLTENLIETLVKKENSNKKISLEEILKVVLHDKIEKAVNHMSLMDSSDMKKINRELQKI